MTGSDTTGDGTPGPHTTGPGTTGPGTTGPGTTEPDGAARAFGRLDEEPAFFDSLVHVTPDGSWLGTRRYDASVDLLERELAVVAPCHALLVGIAGWTDNDQIIALAHSHEGLVPIAGVDPTGWSDPTAGRHELRRLRDEGFAGIKLHPRLNGYDPLDARCLAAMETARDLGLVVMLDTLWRQRGLATRHPADVADAVLAAVPDVPIVLLHGTGATLLELFELGRMYPNVVVDLSFTLLRYQGSSVDIDITFMAEGLDQRMSVGSDFPEYRPIDALERFTTLTAHLPAEKQRNVLSGNLFRLFGPWRERWRETARPR